MAGDPLAGLSLPPGDPVALRTAVASFGRAADALDASGDHQRQAVGQVSGATWKGVAAESARSATGKILDAFHTASSLANDSGDALSQCARDWEAATDEWHQARYLADQAMAQETAVVNAALSGLTSNPTALDYQSPNRHAAQELAQQAIDRFNSASRKVAATLDHLGSKIIASPAFLPVHRTPWYEEPLHWGEDAVNFVGNTFSNAWNVISSNPGAIAKDGLDLLGLVGSVALIGAGGGAEGGGLALDLSGIGLPLGIPLNLAGAAAITAGAGGVGFFADQLGQDLSTHLAQNATSDAAGGEGQTLTPGDLSGEVKSNYGRFLKSLPAGAEDPTIARLPNGDTQFDAAVPATNIPGSFAIYTKVVDTDGSTVTFYKTTYASDGSVVHVKVKYP